MDCRRVHNESVPEQRAQPIRFDAFEVDLAAHELRKRGVRLRLQDQPFQVLAALLEKPGEVVIRQELQDRLWGDDTYVDFDKSLSAAVSKVREALDDSRTRPPLHRDHPEGRVPVHRRGRSRRRAPGRKAAAPATKLLVASLGVDGRAGHGCAPCLVLHSRP